MNKKTRQFIVGLAGTIMFAASFGTQIRTYINNDGLSLFQWVFISITGLGLFLCARLLNKTI